MTRLQQFLLVSGTALLLGLGCTPPTAANGGCLDDSSCPTETRCEVSSGLCLCTGDAACDPGESCNAQGRCQARSGCDTNEDCRSPSNLLDICDVTSGQCVTPDRFTLQCTVKSQCPFGSLCINNRCVEGCDDHGDCVLGQPCMNGMCDATPGACVDNRFCDPGQLCDTNARRCVDHRQRSILCASCGSGLAGVGACGGGTCLVDSSVAPQTCAVDNDCAAWPGATCETAPCTQAADCPGGAACDQLLPIPGLPGTCSVGQCARYFCGSDQCNDETDPCPRGYACYSLIQVTGRRCTLGDNTCTDGRACSAGGENNVTGFCSCIADTDCPVGTACVEPGASGRCVAGTTCGPAADLTCDAL